MARYKTIPHEVEAVQWLGNNEDEIQALLGNEVHVEKYIYTLFVENEVVRNQVKYGEYVVKESSKLARIVPERTFREKYILIEEK